MGVENIFILRFAARSDIGCVRTNNEDSYAFSEPAARIAWAVVCDGMGGAAAGEIASRVAVETFKTAISEIEPDTLTEERLSEVVSCANAKVIAAAEEDSGRRGMGTTLVAVALKKKTGEGWVVHAGDSRLYLIRAGSIQCLTRDHNWGEDLIRSGTVSRDDVRRIRNAGALTRAVGIDPFPGADIILHPFEPEDLILLCSDGLTNVLKDDQILGAIMPSDIESSLDRLIQSAREGGAPDNVTGVLGRVGVCDISRLDEK